MPTELQKLDGMRVYSTRRVWDRASRSEVDLREDRIEWALKHGRVDLVGEGSLPLDRSRPLGAPPLGSGDGTADVFMGTGDFMNPQAVRRLPLIVAQNVVKTGLGFYCDPDGSPLMAPQIEGEPRVEVAEAPAETAAPESSTLAKIARRLRGAVV